MMEKEEKGEEKRDRGVGERGRGETPQLSGPLDKHYHRVKPKNFGQESCRGPSGGNKIDGKQEKEEDTHWEVHVPTQEDSGHASITTRKKGGKREQQAKKEEV